jgi:hypothetical protein
MSLTAAAQKVFSTGSISTSSGAFGIVRQLNGRLVAGCGIGSDTFPFPNSGAWLYSEDNGASWHTLSSTDGVFGQTFIFPTNIKNNIIVTPTYNIPGGVPAIIRSTNSGASWSTVFGPVSSSGRGAFISGCQSYGNGNAVAWGELSGVGTDPPKIFGISTDEGATWSPVDSWDIGDKFDYCNALGIAEDGTWYAQYTKFGGINRTTNFARTDDFGTSWTTLGAPPGGSGTPPNFANAITCFDSHTLAMTGVLADPSRESPPGVWWSNDDGATLNLVSPGDIVNCPTTGTEVQGLEVKRLTRDACLLAFDQQTGTAGSPWRISLDQGQTYPIEITPTGSTWSTYQIPYGKIVVTLDGHILGWLWQSEDYSTAELSLWRITVDC